ncbi:MULTISPECIES: hypothetical protein [unclassified Achromobacter]|jgi:hypothetical protein|uniref:hypothetical protein n=1 Tax=unclassified Achromobacter TaxID=2626865 RepID=UPI00069CBEF0|nr:MULTISPECIES: hypothetical protein [unclassified Achromobacter]KOF53800.1 hypothetical protein AD428_11150 [Achromobacter sp. DMS1]
MRKPSLSRPCTGLLNLSAAALLALAPFAAEADHDRHRHRHGREYKEKYWDGACKVERQWKRNGEYREKRKCRPDYGYAYAVPRAAVQPVVPAIVINPPPIVIRP